MIARILIALLASAVLFAQETSADTRLRHSEQAFEAVMKAPDKGIPQDLIDKAQCVVIVPDLIKAAFIVGGQYGRGFASCRTAHGWSAPAAVRMEGGSFGLQLGGASTDLILLVMNEHGMDRLLGSKFAIGGDVTGAAGPVGRQISARTDAQLHAEILSWSRSRGAFAGLALDGTTFRPDDGENAKLYGKDVTNRDILLGNAVRTPAGARGFVAMLNRYSATPAAAEASNRKSPPASPDRTAPPSQSLSQPGGKVTLGERQIRFAVGKSEIPKGADAALADVARAMTDHPDWTVRIEGYTDNTGSSAANMKLSEKRANAVARWLEQHGVDKARITTKGYGEANPAGDNSTAEGRAQNRRVEIVRTDKGAPKG